MYIPVSFFGGVNLCTGSGFCYPYGNTSTASADAITYTSLCGITSSSLTISPNFVEKFAAVSASVSGLATTTKLAGQPYTISSSCNLIQPYEYTITRSGVGTGTDIYWYQQDVNTNPTRAFVDNSTGTRLLQSIFPPQLTYRSITAAGVFSTITSSSPTGSVTFNTDWTTDTVRKWRFPMITGSFSLNTSLYGKPYIRNILIPSAMDNSPGFRYEMYSETTPYIEFTTPFPTNADRLAFNFNPEIGIVQTVSSSCWDYQIISPNVAVTINYLNCSNVSASVVVGIGETKNICAKYESIVLPSLTGGTNLQILLGGACSTPIALPSGSIPVSQSIWSAIDLAYSDYSITTFKISDLSGNNNNLNNSTSSWNLTTTSSVSGNIFETSNLTNLTPLTWDNTFPVSSYSLLLAWRPTTIYNTAGSGYKSPILSNSDNSGNDYFGMFGETNDVYAGDSSQIDDYEQCGTNGATLNNWHISQISVNNSTLSSSYCIDGITGSMGPTGLAEDVVWRLFGGFVGGIQSWYTGSMQFQVAAIYSGSLSNDQMVRNWNALKGRYGL